MGSARRVRLSARRTERVPRRLWDLLRGRGVLAVHRSADHRVRGEPAGAKPEQRRSPAFYLDDGFPAANVVRPPFINPTFANGTNILAVAPDGLTLPRFQNWSVTYQRQLTENMMLDVSYIGNRGSRLNHHFNTLGVNANMNDPSVLVARRHGAAVGHQFAGGTGGRHHTSISRIRRQRGTGAQKVPPVPADRVARRAERQEPVSRARTRARTPLLARPAGARRLHLLAAEEQRRRERAGRYRQQRRRAESGRPDPSGHSARTTRRTSSWSDSPGRFPARRGGHRHGRKRYSAAGTSPAFSATKAAGPSTSS